MKLVDIQAESNVALSIDERSHIRRIIGVSELSSNTYYDQSETTFDAIAKRVIPDGITVALETQNIFRCRELRLLYKDYDKLGDGNLLIDGGRDGIRISTSRDRLRIALQLWNRVFGTGLPVPNENIFSEISSLEKRILPTDNGTFASVPVTFNDTLNSDDYRPAPRY